MLRMSYSQFASKSHDSDIQRRMTIVDILPLVPNIMMQTFGTFFFGIHGSMDISVHHSN